MLELTRLDKIIELNRWVGGFFLGVELDRWWDGFRLNRTIG